MQRVGKEQAVSRAVLRVAIHLLLGWQRCVQHTLTDCSFETKRYLSKCVAHGWQLLSCLRVWLDILIEVLQSGVLRLACYCMLL